MMPNQRKFRARYRRLLLIASLTFSGSIAASPALAQAPVPGQAPSPSGYPAQSGHAAGYRSGASPVPTESAYQQLPLSANDAQSRLDELKSLLPETRPQEMREPVYQLCEWLADLADGHNRLANSFAKNEATKPQADQERRSAQKFASLKNQAQLLKAELLIKEKRFPEALGPLVEIVAAEPRSATGQAAYRRLKELGFSEEVEVKQAELPPAVPASADGQGTGDAASSARTQPAKAGKPQSVSTKVPAAGNPAGARGSHGRVWISGSPAGKR